MKNFEFSFPTHVVFGRHAESRLGELAQNFGSRAMVLYGSNRVKLSGLLPRLIQDLEAHGLTVTEFGGIQENPNISQAEAGRRLACETGASLLVAVGGGSVIDTAKAIAIGAKNKGTLWDFYLRRNQAADALPIGVVLTAAATASEANAVSVLCRDRTKIALDEPLSRPRFALMNPELTYTVPPYQTAAGAADIFAHAFERYFHKEQWGTLRCELCGSVMRTVIAELPRALASPCSYDARSQLMWAATVAHSDMAGLEGDFACHALSHILTEELGLAHGAALAILMPAWCAYIAERESATIAAFSRQIWQVPDAGCPLQTARAGAAAFREFIASAGLPTTLRAAGFPDLSPTGLADLAIPADGASIGGKFRPLYRDDVIALLRLAQG